MPNSPHRSKVTIEDLLHLKRAERPAAEFWSNFERELRQKQLTALLEKRPWWQELPQLFVRRAYFPIGATAIVGFTLLSVKYYTLPTQVVQLEDARAAVHLVLSHQNESLPAQRAAAPVSSPLVNRRDQTDPEISKRTSVAAEPQLPARTAALAPTVDTPFSAETPSARSIAANLARLEQSEPDLINAVLGSRLSSPTHFQVATSGAVVELASLATSNSRRSRLLAHYDDDRQLNPEPAAPDLVRERLSRRLGDAELIERFNRIGLKGDQVSLGLTLRL